MTASEDATSRVAREETSRTGRPPLRQLLAEELQGRGASRPAGPDGHPGPAVDLDEDGPVRVAGVAEHETLRVRQVLERDARRQLDDAPPPRVGGVGGRSSRWHGQRHLGEDAVGQQGSTTGHRVSGHQ